MLFQRESEIMIISFYGKAHATINDKHVENKWVWGKSETNDKIGGILVSEQEQSSGKMNGVVMAWIKARKQDEERKKERKREARSMIMPKDTDFRALNTCYARL